MTLDRHVLYEAAVQGVDYDLDFLQRVYRVHRGGRLPLVHVDAYRLGSVEEVDDLDLDADLPESVTVVEWGHGLVEQLADAHLLVRLDRAVDREERTAELVGSGGDWAQRLAGLGLTSRS